MLLLIQEEELSLKINQIISDSLPTLTTSDTKSPFYLFMGFTINEVCVYVDGSCSKVLDTGHILMERLWPL